MLSRYWVEHRGLNEIAPLSSLLRGLRSSRQKKIPVPGCETIQSIGWDWTYIIDFDRGRLSVSFGENGAVDWPFDEIPGRHETYGSLFWHDSDDGNQDRVLKLIGRQKDITEKGPSMDEYRERLVDYNVS